MTDLIGQWQAVYQQRIQLAGYQEDTAQLAIVEQFARIEKAMTVGVQRPTQNKKMLSRFLSKSKNTANRPDVVKGLYLFGAVGRGKTFLMDMFCECIPFSVKRLHFHHFMKSVHDELKHIKEQENPLSLIAADFAAAYRILCLDEFMVTDITDAMLLYGLLKDLINHGVVIITTTNIAPDDLYKDGLQRARFLPAIDLIKTHLVIHEIAQGQDFRRLFLDRHPRFFSPLNAVTQAKLVQISTELSRGLKLKKNAMITINQREIPFVAKSQAVIWFTFADICEGYRSQMDYIELAKCFSVMIVSDIPLLDQYKEDAARRFLLLIDELYDRRIDLILSSAVPIENIYSGKKITFEFERLQSRLFEMQSKEYGR